MSDRQDVKRKEAVIDNGEPEEWAVWRETKREMSCVLNAHDRSEYLTYACSHLGSHASHPAVAPLSVVPGMDRLMLLSRLVVLHVLCLGR